MDYNVLGYQDTPTKQKHRKTILDEAFILFVKRSIHMVTMDDIAKASDMTLRTIYNYYNSKEEIAIDLQISAIHALQMAKITQLEFDNGFEETAHWIRYFGEWFYQNKDLTTYITIFDYSFTEQYPNFRLVDYLNENNVGHIIYESVARGVKDGSIIQKDPSELAYTVAQVAFAYVQKFIYHEMVTTFEPINPQIGDYQIFMELMINSLRNNA
jgi:AcrR family transcriptional regulator